LRKKIWQENVLEGMKVKMDGLKLIIQQMRIFCSTRRHKFKLLNIESLTIFFINKLLNKILK
jgi:hypothetical protein